jgi:hypothetical protein
MDVRYDRLILSMIDAELEQFCRAWVEKKSGYFEVKRYAGSGDLGRDVVGFLTNKRHDADWDNYQCKQYRSGVAVGQGLLAVGKILYWAWKGEFTLPRKFFFVAPRRLARKLEGYVDKPTEMKKALLDGWDTTCAKQITAKQIIALDTSLRAFIEAFDFTSVHSIDIDDMMADPAVKPLLIGKFGADPGAYPPAVVPNDIESGEMRYIMELVDAYGEREKSPFKDNAEVLAHAEHGIDLRRHRDRYFEADAFQKFYRDNTSMSLIANFRKDIHYGVIDDWNQATADTLARVQNVMKQAGAITPAGPLAKYAHVPVKQGMCHHFVNDGELSWKVKKP